MENKEDLLEEALQLLLKLSNKPHFFYVDEVKEIAGKVHQAANTSGTKQDWISVEDRLPELKVCGDRKAVSVEVWCYNGVSVFRDSFCIDSGFHKSITHWKEIVLPTPPKKGDLNEK